MVHRLSKDLFESVIANAPLISIDLIVQNSKGEFLLGYRNNKPAQNYWFVPGGRIFKSETIPNAFKRIAHDELNLNLDIDLATFKGVYEHHYDDSFVSDDVTTHYIVLAYAIFNVSDSESMPDIQHAKFKWFSKEELLVSDSVHTYTKNYFQERH
ncbi:GDP-mannose mannosyl hydrolase [Pantoea ananatis]|jgi:colanic acid biosynthesis protein WcaH|uniref:GDP-mannose mannosyl hydrolase n=1 Tax=Pantoea ananas TaxID=553 RepID=UPI0003104FB8|nr:GDP-mannose mannosyl hydrolase [Pantoea ananatis]KNA27935.1 GDP-mannose mannosyl hydrolase [Pantoea ananatis]MBA4820254.1 GDP-mannose mannosyl hydrolase [Pantoea ananatis]MDJ0030460.1 GDP-mannose mannosyl hydrolase [Pantoea ananatis]MDJ0043739.1 GDP-mannose mannosyl hydrolase [Pantoea ananatis]MDN4133212.1 GDP-mannose mannosyl hydrolase [Pantoea ananatis]